MADHSCATRANGPPAALGQEPSLVIDRIEEPTLVGPIVDHGPRTRAWVGRFLVGAGLVTSAVMVAGLPAG